jgi:hypothetical protein
MNTLAPPIRLYTFQANAGARRFYERHGFVPIEFTDGQANEERCPDVLYELRTIAGTRTPLDILRKRLAADVSEQCRIVCAYLGEDTSFEQGSLIRNVLNEIDTDGWWFFNPGTFIVAFRAARPGARRASACEAALARLRQVNPAVAHLAVGSAEGPVLTSIASAGHLDTPPIGNVVNEAFRKAVDELGSVR